MMLVSRTKFRQLAREDPQALSVYEAELSLSDHHRGRQFEAIDEVAIFLDVVVNSRW